MPSGPKHPKEGIPIFGLQMGNVILWGAELGFRGLSIYLGPGDITQCPVKCRGHLNHTQGPFAAGQSFGFKQRSDPDVLFLVMVVMLLTAMAHGD